MTNSIFNETLINAHVAYGKAMLAGEKASTKFYDSVSHIPYTHWFSPKGAKAQGTASQEWYDAMVEAVAKGRLTAKEYKLYSADTRSLSNDAQKQAKRDAIQKVGSLVKDVRNAIKNRQEKKTSNAKGKAQMTKAPSDKLRSQFDSIIKTIQGNDAWEFDAADMIAAINKLAKQV